MMQTTYTTKVGDRWDSVAAVLYGDATKLGVLIRANTSVPIRVTIPAGTVLNVPIIQQTEVQSNNLPPWKR